MRYAIFLSLVFSTFNLQAAELESETSYGRALDAKTGELLYSEKHVTKFKEGRIETLHTEYYNLKKEKFANLNSNFSVNPYLPEYTFTDSRFGREDGVRNLKDDKKIEVFAKPKAGDDTKTKKMNVSPMLITGQGLHSYMNANLDRLIKKDSATDIDFLIPMNQKAYNFEIKKLSVEGGRAEFKVKIRSWFLSMFAPHLEVTYEVKTKRLLMFEGPSNINSDSNDTQNVKIVYSYDKKPEDVGPND